MQLIALGNSRGDIAAQLAIDPATLSKWWRLPSFQQELGKFLDAGERESVESLRAIRLLAVERLLSLINSPNQTVALKAIELVLSKIELPVATVISGDHYKRRSISQFEHPRRPIAGASVVAVGHLKKYAISRSDSG